MNFLIDAQLPPALARLITSLGHHAQRVEDVGALLSTDEAIGPGDGIGVLPIWREGRYGGAFQVPGVPLMHMLCSVTPVGPRQLASWRLDAAFAGRDELRSHVVESFRGSIARPVHSRSTLRGMSCPITTQDLLPAGCPSVAGQD